VKILLADDDAVSRRLLQRSLERSGFEVVCVADGVGAAERLRAPGGPRIAILDWVMPGKDGPTVCREFRAATGCSYVYLILLTSREAIGDVVLGLEAGADDYLIKPCNPEEMKARVRAGQRILELQDKLVFEARHDSLTRLPNRAFFEERLHESTRRAQDRKGYQFALLFVDIDRFKMINDVFGHRSGDQVMNEVAQRLVQAVRTEAKAPRAMEAVRRRDSSDFDVVARIGGDEFVVLLDDIVDVNDGIRVAERIRIVLETPFAVSGREIQVSVSIGISTSNGNATDATEMLKGADAAMYKAKGLGKARYEVNDPAA